ncbi:MAG TPA: serine/threonine-protein kinase [Thermoanaerobaculia bacterium]|nr:serine/threonine-protein kinase [Thermoanaerobaculia bacterium]
MNNDDLIELVETLKAALFHEVRGEQSGYVPDEYRELRKALQNHPEIRSQLPEWLRRGSSLREAVSLIRDEAGDEGGKWARRQKIVSDGLNPLIEFLEGSDVLATGLFEKLERIGGGGFGEVFRYRHKLLERDFALKLLNPSPFTTDIDHAIARFFQEGRILFDLRHPNIVQVYDVGLIGKRAFIRMELIEGSSLTSRIRDRGGLTVRDARVLVRELASALEHAHNDVRVVHRDLKPSNIMIENTGRSVLLDFGLGAFVEDEIVSRITRTGEAPAGGIYTAPELLRDPTIRDPLTDVYSLGVIWYESVVGLPPSGHRIESALQEQLDMRDSERDLLLRCLGVAGELQQVASWPQRSVPSPNSDAAPDANRAAAVVTCEYRVRLAPVISKTLGERT